AAIMHSCSPCLATTEITDSCASDTSRTGCHAGCTTSSTSSRTRCSHCSATSSPSAASRTGCSPSHGAQFVPVADADSACQTACNVRQLQQDSDRNNGDYRHTKQRVPNALHAIQIGLRHVPAKKLHDQCEDDGKKHDREGVIEDLPRPQFKEACSRLPQQREDKQRPKGHQYGYRHLGNN